MEPEDEIAKTHTHKPMMCITKGTPPRRKNGFALPEFVDPFFHQVFPYILTSMSLFDTVWSFLTPKSSKVPKL